MNVPRVCADLLSTILPSSPAAEAGDDARTGKRIFRMEADAREKALTKASLPRFLCLRAGEGCREEGAEGGREERVGRKYESAAVNTKII